MPMSGCGPAPTRRGHGWKRSSPSASSACSFPRRTTSRCSATRSPTCAPSTSWWWACWGKGWPRPPGPILRPRAWASTFEADRFPSPPGSCPPIQRSSTMDFIESDELQMLREAVGSIASKFGHDYYVAKAHADERTDELWNAVAEAGFLGVNVPEAVSYTHLRAHET